MFAVGPYPTKTYLDDDPVSLSAFLCLGQERTWSARVAEALLVASEAAAATEEEAGSVLGSETDGEADGEAGSTGGGGRRSGGGGGGAAAGAASSTATASSASVSQPRPAAAAAGAAQLRAASSSTLSLASRGSLATERGSPLCRVQTVSFVAGGASARGGGGGGGGGSRGGGGGGCGDSRRIISEVDGLEVSVSANQLHELCIVAIVEHADAAIGRCHLLKRSLLLFRAWARHDSPTFGTLDALSRTWLPTAQQQQQQQQHSSTPGAGGGGSGGGGVTPLRQHLLDHSASSHSVLAGLSWRACVTLMLWTFVRRREAISQPFQALAWLLADLAAFE